MPRRLPMRRSKSRGDLGNLLPADARRESKLELPELSEVEVARALTARQIHDESGRNDYEIRAISQLWLSVFSSFAYSFFSMKAYANSHKAILTINDVTLCRS